MVKLSIYLLGYQIFAVELTRRNSQETLVAAIHEILDDIPEEEPEPEPQTVMSWPRDRSVIFSREEMFESPDDASEIAPAGVPPED
jgi:hypothetical protein